MSALTKKSDTHEERYYFVDVPFHARVYKATVFFRKKDSGDGFGMRWLWAVAFCARGDEFSKKQGRTVARRRFFSDEKNLNLVGHGFIDTAEAHRLISENMPVSDLVVAFRPSFEHAKKIALRAARSV